MTTTLQVLRTPESRFANLPDYPFQPHHVTVAGGRLRMHYLDERPEHPSGDTVLLLHGNPRGATCTGTSSRRSSRPGTGAWPST
ncbi:hypothetical protein ACFQQB_23050 [Nonomuraea rubra]|uniref:hypothetical protein n=1 Tax=Nonomuraea rubra TaxID=46180 RepID=UPI003608734A